MKIKNLVLLTILSMALGVVGLKAKDIYMFDGTAEDLRELLQADPHLGRIEFKEGCMSPEHLEMLKAANSHHLYSITYCYDDSLDLFADLLKWADANMPLGAEIYWGSVTFFNDWKFGEKEIVLCLNECTDIEIRKAQLEAIFNSELSSYALYLSFEDISGCEDLIIDYLNREGPIGLTKISIASNAKTLPSEALISALSRRPDLPVDFVARSESGTSFSVRKLRQLLADCNVESIDFYQWDFSKQPSELCYAPIGDYCDALKASNPLREFSVCGFSFENHADDFEGLIDYLKSDAAKELRSFGMFNVTFSSDQWVVLCEVLRNLENLEELEFHSEWESFNTDLFETDGNETSSVQLVVDTARSLPRLKHLMLERVRIDGNAISLDGLTHLKSLEFKIGEISNWNALGEELSKLSQLEELFLMNHDRGAPEGNTELLRAIGQMKGLKRLDLGGFECSSDQADALRVSLPHCRRMGIN